MTAEDNNLFYGRPSTVRSQKCLFNNWIRPYLLEDPVLNEAYLVQMVRCWESQELASGTISMLLAILKRYIRLKTGVEIKAPRLTRTLQNMNKEPIKAFTREQLKKLLEVAKSKDTYLYDLIIIAVHTGMRPGEVFALKGKDINLLSRKINIVNTKTGRPRTVKITTEVENVLQKYLIPGKESSPLFQGKIPNERLKSLCQYGKLPVRTFHAFRHTHATLALEAGKSPRDVARQLGHARVSTTLDVYWAAVNDELEIDYIP